MPNIMGAIDRLWTFLCSLDRFMLLLLVGAIAFSITLIVLLWTRWGHSRSLEKCVLLSFLAHALLTGYAATVQISAYRPAPREQFVRIALVDGPPGAEHGQADGTDPGGWPGGCQEAAAFGNPGRQRPRGGEEGRESVHAAKAAGCGNCREAASRTRASGDPAGAEAIGGHGLCRFRMARWPKRQGSICRTSARPTRPN